LALVENFSPGTGFSNGSSFRLGDSFPTAGRVSSSRPATAGFFYALLAYGSWGLFPLYWKSFGTVSPVEIVSHRVLWSLILLTVLTLVSGQGRETWRVLRDGKRLLLLALTATLLSINWGLFIYGVVSSQVVEASLGYFLNPLVSILLALLFLKERLNLIQTMAVLLAACGVVHFGWFLGRLPWIALSLALTFGLYGLLRKTIAVSPLVGLLIETALMAPAALALVGILSSQGKAAFGSSMKLSLLFFGAGVVTTLPLLWFNSAAKLLRLSTMGFLQYLAPTLQLLVGVIVFQEAFTTRQAISFALIWSAIGIYLLSLLRSRRFPDPVPDAD
jgi:chloramphenicol-sensitive protein RarD